MGKKIHVSDNALEILEDDRSPGQSYSGRIEELAEQAQQKVRH